ncbi:MAG: 50S ribosomal protein L25/general stress protein Ctc [Bacteroidales bacterium]|nr:50S ribosomal protein L25/general stress protein Ctc [Bacteroidales bacterium]
MLKISMSGSPRENVGKKDAKALRNAGQIPCVLYGTGEQVHFSIDAKSFDKVIFTPNTYIIELDLNGKVVKAILQDIQYHPTTDLVLHADFLQIVEGKTIKTAVSVKTTGNSAGVIKGGKLAMIMRKVRVEGLEENIPDYVTLDISKLDIGQSIKIKEIEMENIKFLDVPNNVVVSIRTTRAAAAALAAAAKEA